MTERIVAILSWAALGVLVALAVAAVAAQRGGSLDDLNAEDIKRAVNAAHGKTVGRA